MRNVFAAFSRFREPQMPIRKNSAISVSSKNRKNRIRSRARKTPSIPVSSSRNQT